MTEMTELCSGDDTEDTKIPFCKAQLLGCVLRDGCGARYRWPGFSVQGEDGLNNMGKKTMEIIDFMCGTLSWTLAVVNGGNVGENRVALPNLRYLMEAETLRTSGRRS